MECHLIICLLNQYSKPEIGMHTNAFDTGVILSYIQDNECICIAPSHRFIATVILFYQQVHRQKIHGIKFE